MTLRAAAAVAVIAAASASACSGRGAAVDHSGDHTATGTGTGATGTATPAASDAVTATLMPTDAVTATLTPTDAATPDAYDTAIVDRPIAWPAERDAAMLAYRRAHSDPDAADTTIEPRMIVLHYTAGGSAQATMSYFDRLHLEEAREDLRKGGDVNVSSHFLVDRDGTIYRLMPETRMARHAIGVNHIAIGIENVGDEARYPLTDAQVTADAALIRYLVARHPITLLVGHLEVRSLDGTPWFVERDPRYRNRKPDPGARFMAAVRAEVTDLGLRDASDPGTPP